MDFLKRWFVMGKVALVNTTPVTVPRTAAGTVKLFMIMFTTSKNGNFMKLVGTVVAKNLIIFSRLCSDMAKKTGLRFTRTSFTTGSVTADSVAPTKAPTAPWEAAPMILLTKVASELIV